MASANKQLLAAAEAGDLDAVKRALSKGANIETVDDWYKSTALIIAAANNRKNVVRYLISRGANIDAQDRNGWTALVYAANNGLDQIVNILLGNGANVNTQANNGQTALMYAAMWGNYEIVNILLSKRANVNTQDNLGQTAVMIAAENGRKEAVEVLITHDADVSVKDDDGLTALELASNPKFAALDGDYPAVIKILSTPPAATPILKTEDAPKPKTTTPSTEADSPISESEIEAEFEQKCIALTCEVDSLKQENTNLTSEVDSLKQNNTAYISEIDFLNKKNMALTSEVDSLKQNKTACTSEIDSCKQENVALKSEVDSLKCENNSLSGKQMELEKLFQVSAQSKQIVLDETEEQMMRIKEEDIQGQTIDDFGLSDNQLDELIVESDMFYLARCFGAWTLYTGNPGLQLTPGDQHTIIADPNLVNNQMKMKKALMMWQSSNPILATFRRLLQILLILEEGDVAIKISQYIKSSIRLKNNTLATEAVNISSEIGSLTSEVGATPREVDDLTTEGGPTTSKYCVVASDEDTQSVQNSNLTTDVGALKSEIGILLAALDTLKSQVTTLTSENDSAKSEQKNRNTTFGELEADTAEEQMMMNDLELQERRPLIPLTSAEEPNMESSNPAHGCCVVM